MKKPFLVGERVYLRRLDAEDIGGNYLAWLNDADVCRYNSHHVLPYTREAAERYLRGVADSPQALVLAVVLVDGDRHIGNVALQGINPVSRSGEFAILVGEKDCWGRGYAREAARLLLRHGFLELNLHRIHCGTSADNLALQGLALGLGMREEGRRREALFKHGRYVDMLEYGLLRGEFEARDSVAAPAPDAATGRPAFPGLRYCVRCCMPETQEGIVFDELGICQACQSSEQKMSIDWSARERELRAILERAHAGAGDNYDCIVPISGGKDSTFQLHVLVKVYGLKPLAVTFSHNWFSRTGWYNLVNALETFNVDHIMFTPNRGLVNRIARRSLAGIGDSCWHCHAGCGAFPLQVATRFRIPLLVYGESIAESSGRASYRDPVHRFDRDYFTKVSAKLRPEEMVDATLSARDLHPFRTPTAEECAAAGVFGIHLGDYLFWDEERQTEFVRDTYGWRETDVEGTYKRYKSAECVMPGVHDYTCYLKRGYGRATFHASSDVRAGLLTREEGFCLANAHDSQRPEALDYFLRITGMTEEQFEATMLPLRHPRLAGVSPPVTAKDHANAERILPFAEQVLEEGRSVPAAAAAPQSACEPPEEQP